MLDADAQEAMMAAQEALQAAEEAPSGGMAEAAADAIAGDAEESADSEG